MTEHAPIPVAGYTSQTQSNVDLANEGKELEERVLRYLEKLVTPDVTVKSERNRYVAIAKTDIQTGFMWAIRSIFNPQRIKLPDDAQ